MARGSGDLKALHHDHIMGGGCVPSLFPFSFLLPSPSLSPDPNCREGATPLQGQAPGRYSPGHLEHQQFLQDQGVQLLPKVRGGGWD